MAAPDTVYCTQCGFAGERSNPYCTHCGMPQQLTPKRRAGHVAFLLNELHASPMKDVVTVQQRARLETHYEDELRSHIAPRAERRDVPVATTAVPAWSMWSGAPAAREGVAASTPAPTQAAAPPRAPAPPRPPAPPREPFDWSWLAEQQANLFLFAGAFLTVVAALIYVGYSGEAVDGSLKMSLLVAYTLAFLAAGAVCLRNPRVEIAGRVFFGVGALLVPMNFVAARSILSDSDLSRETMWLAGSVTTAAFYAAVAWLGMGRTYAIGAGVALISGAIAAAYATSIQAEWAALLFIGVAFAMTLVKHVELEDVRERIGVVWDPMGQAFGAAAMGWAMLVAAYGIEWGDDLSTLWFLPITFAAFAAATGVLGYLRKQEYLGATALAALAAGGVSIAYALDLPAEGWAIVAAAVAAYFGLLLLVVDESRIARVLPPKSHEYVFGYGVLLTGIAAAIAFFVLQAAHGEDPATYELRTRWFLAASAGLALAFYALAAASPRGRATGVGPVVSVGAMGAFVSGWIAVIYGFGWPAEAYAIGIAAMAPVLGLALIAAQDKRIARLLPAMLDDVAYVTGIGATIVAAGIAVVVLIAAHADDPTYELGTRWFAAATAGLTLAFYALAAAAGRGKPSDAPPIVSMGAITSFVAGWVAVIYGFGWPAEAYAIGIAGVAPVLGLGLIAAQDKRIARLLPATLDDLTYITGIAATIVAAGITVVLLIAAHQDVDPYMIENRWLLLPVFPLAALFYALDAGVLRRRVGVPGFAIALAGCCAATVYALDVSAEYYAFTPIAPAIALIAAVRWAPARLTANLHAEWREDIIALGRVGSAIGIVFALMAVAYGADSNEVWQPQSHIFLPAALLAAAVFFCIDASREKRVETSLAFVAALGAAAVTVPYAFFADAAYYGVALVATGIIFAASGRVFAPSWLDGRVRDGLAVAAVAASTLPFEYAYADVPGIGAGVHFAAAFVFGMAAISDRSERTLGSLLDVSDLKVRVSAGWLYAATLCAGIGYVFTIRGVVGEENAEGASLAMPMLAATLALIAVGVGTKFWRPEFRMHFYLMSLLAALVSIATSGDAQSLAIVMTALVGAYVVLSLIEDAPLLAAPSALFGFVAIAAWRVHLDGSFAVLPIAYSLVGVGAYCAAFALKDQLPRWSLALRATGAAYALAAPAAGFGVLSSQAEGGFVGEIEFERTALYQFSTVGVAAVGVLALVESLIARRRWIIVPASAVMTIALLLQIVRFEPQNPQVYTAVIGSYLVLLAVIGLSRMKLIRELEPAAVYIEALGAATVMLPSFVQSIDAGWRYQWILLIEAAVFFAIGVGLRRRGLLSAGALFLVLVAGRALLDALNAMPNWIVVALCGICLLGIGMGILLGRERWDSWQRTVVSWWENAGETNGAVAS